MRIRPLLLGLLLAAAALPASAQALTVTQCFHHSGQAGCVDARGTVWAERAVVSPDGRHVYVAAGSGDYGALTTFARDARTGRLRQLPGKAGCTSATGADHEVVGGPRVCTRGEQLAFLDDLVMSEDGRTLYTLSGGGSDVRHGVGVFRRDPATGRIAQQQCFAPRADISGCTQGAFQAPSALALAPGGRTLLVGGESLSTFALGEDGLIEGAGTCVLMLYNEEVLEPCAGAPENQRLHTIERLAVDPAGTRLYGIGFDDYGSQLQAYALDPQTGAPSPAGCAGAAPCTRARGLHEIADVEVSPDGKGVYVAGNRFMITEETNIEGVITTSAIAAFSGAGLAQLPGTRGCVLYAGKAKNPGCGAARPPFLGASAIAVTPDGKRALAGFGSTGALVLLRRSAATQALTPVAGRSGCLAERSAGPAFAKVCPVVRTIGYPNDIAISPDGRHAYVVNQDGLVVVPMK